MAVMLRNRKVPEEEMDREKLADLVVKSKEGVEEDQKMSLEDKNAVELLRMMEESVNEKQKTYRLKKQFMENIRKMKEAQQAELGKLFDKLNQVEDEYLVSERVLANLQMAIKQNADEVKHVQSRMQFTEEEKRKLEVEASRLEEELQAVKNFRNDQGSQQGAIQKKIADYKAQIEAKIKEAETTQAKLVGEQMAAFEAKCKLELIESKATELAAELQNLTKAKAKRDAELAAKVQALRDHLKNKSKSEDEIERIKALLATIDGTDFTRACLCDLKGDMKNSMFEVVYKADQLVHAKQPYPFYEQMVADFLAEKDVG